MSHFCDTKMSKTGSTGNRHLEDLSTVICMVRSVSLSFEDLQRKQERSTTKNVNFKTVEEKCKIQVELDSKQGNIIYDLKTKLTTETLGSKI